MFFENDIIRIQKHFSGVGNLIKKNVWDLNCEGIFIKNKIRNIFWITSKKKRR